MNKHVLRIITGGALIVLTTLAQSTTAPLAFEVASVKRGAGGGPPGDVPRNMDSSPGHFAMRNVAFRFALEWAYDLKDYEVSGPDWIKGDERYEIIAKAAGPASEDQMRLMLQTLLTERFQMKIHRETKDLPVYALTVGKGAPKIKEAVADGQPPLSGSANGVAFHNQPISRFTFLLTRRMDRPVLDLTGLKGLYDYTVDISGLGNQPGSSGMDGEGPSIFTAVQDGLGLKLEPRKHPIQMLVIDALNKDPIAN
jgi:uncharacterized protein (TIGR03435 family)